jgi:hypothetical protein
VGDPVDLRLSDFVRLLGDHGSGQSCDDGKDASAMGIEQAEYLSGAKSGLVKDTGKRKAPESAGAFVSAPLVRRVEGRLCLRRDHV